MSSKEFEKLIQQRPADREVLERFRQLVSTAPDHGSLQYTVDRLYDRLQPSSLYDLSRVLQALVDARILTKVVRVESPTTGGGLADYSSISQVPLELHDYYEDVDIEVKPENIKVIYQVQQPHKALR